MRVGDGATAAGFAIDRAALARAVSDSRKRRACLPSYVALRFLFATALLLFLVSTASAQLGGELPQTTITSDEAASTPATPAAHAAKVRRHPAPRKHSRAEAQAQPSRHTQPPLTFHVEPARGELSLKSDSWAYEEPAKSSKKLQRFPAGETLAINGTTHYFARVRLKDGRNGFVPLSVLNLMTPADKIRQLGSDAAVLSQPNPHGTKLSEVHHGHDVHIVGITMNYVRIRMRSGLEGFIPMTALR